VCIICKVKNIKKNVFFFIFFFVFKEVNGYFIDNNRRKKNESFDYSENKIMVYSNPITLHLHYDLEKPGYQGY